MTKKILVLSGVSAVGKTTISNLLKSKHNFQNSISYTTREIRENETQNQYNFISMKEFETKIEKNFFIEHTKIFNNYYGTSMSDVENLIKKHNVIMTLCPIGYKIIKSKWNYRTIGFYLLPPSEDTLRARMQDRNSSLKEIDQRLDNIYMQSKKDSLIYDYVIKPQTIENTLTEILKIFNR